MYSGDELYGDEITSGVTEKETRCGDCGEWGELTGHMGCQYPGMRSESYD